MQMGKKTDFYFYQVKFTGHKTNHFTVYNSVAFSIITMLCNLYALWGVFKVSEKPLEGIEQRG